MLSEYSRTNTVVYTGVAPQPEGQVVISEIMYNPLVLDASFVEIRNTSPTASFDLSGWRLSGVSFAFPPGTVLTNGQFLVVCKDALAFARAYNPSVYIAGEFSGQLNPAGETLTLLRPGSHPGEELIVNRVRYEAQPPWSQAPNGHGASLQLIDAAQDNSRVSNWADHEEWRNIREDAAESSAVLDEQQVLTPADGGTRREFVAEAVDLPARQVEGGGAGVEQLDIGGVCCGRICSPTLLCTLRQAGVATRPRGKSVPQNLPAPKL